MTDAPAGQAAAPSSKIKEAAAWLAEQWPLPRPIVPELRRRFGLSSLEVVVAIRVSLPLRAAAMLRTGAR